MAREEFERELAELRESLIRMGSLVESQIAGASAALRDRDREGANQVRAGDAELNELFRDIRERSFLLIARQQPVAGDLRLVMGIGYMSTELERIGDYAVRIARLTLTLCGLPHTPLRAEFGVLAELAIQQVRDVLDALIESDEVKAREVAGKDDEIDRVYHRLFDELISDMTAAEAPEEALRSVTLMLVAHNMERIADRVTNVAEDIVFLETGQVVELG